MADLSITATAVLPGPDATTENGTAGAIITAGQTVTIDPTTGRYVLTDADGAADIRRPRGIALNGASAGQPVRILKAGDLTVNAVLTKGVAVYQSATPGGLCGVDDVTTGNYVSVIGVAKSTTTLSVNIQHPGVAV